MEKGILVDLQRKERIKGTLNNMKWFRKYWIDQNLLDILKYPNEDDCGNKHMHTFRALIWKGEL
jgi:hypothetical protein